MEIHFAGHSRFTNKCALSKKKKKRPQMPKKPTLCILTVQKGGNTCIQETVKEPLNGLLFIHKCNMVAWAAPFVTV